MSALPICLPLALPICLPLALPLALPHVLPLVLPLALPLQRPRLTSLAPLPPPAAQLTHQPHHALPGRIAKILILLATVGGTIFMPNDVFAAYAWVARFVAPIFNLFMLVM